MDEQLEALVWQRANSRCEYCHIAMHVDDLPFQIDHIIARQHSGQTVPNNLALACLHCNKHKGPNIAGLDSETRLLTPLFNPRTDNWDEHFTWEEPFLEALTPVGRTTIHVLAMNHPLLIALRRALIEEGVVFD